jgi:superfamily I DNA/RNA helicase
MGPGNARKVIDHLTENAYAFASLQAFVPPQAAAASWHKLCELMCSLGDPQRQWPGQVHAAREWYRPHFERIYEHFHTRLGDLDQLELLSGQYPSRERFLSELTLDPPNATSDLAGKPTLDEDFLTLTTVHSAKGMEWDVVYVLNVVDGRKLPVGILDRQGGADRGGASPAVRLPHAGTRRSAPDGAPEVPSHQPIAPGGCARVWRPQPLPHGQGPQAARGGDLPRIEHGWPGGT